MLSIKLTEVADLKCQDIPGHKTSLASPLFIEVPVSSQESEWSRHIYYITPNTHIHDS
jgi:hypothetical protein